VANDIKVLTFIANEMLRQTKNNLQYVKNVGGQEFASMFVEAPKKGSSFTIRKSTRFVGRTGETFSAEDYKEREVSMTVGDTIGLDLEFTNRQLMLEMDQISERVVKPAAATLASLIDTTYLLKAINATYQQVGTPGTVPTALKTYNQARAKMSWMSCPNDGHTMLITPDMQVEAVDAGKSFFGSHADDHYETGLLGKHSGAKVYEVQNLPTHTNGQRGGTPLMNGATASGATSIVTDGWTASAANRVKEGDVFQITGVYAVNPWTRQSTGQLQDFVATADAASDGSGNATISISPAIITTGPFQNVSALPADNAPLIFTSAGAGSLAYPVGLRFHKDAFLFGTLNQPTVRGKEFCKVVTDPQTGLTIRYIRDWDTEANKQLDRFDVVPAFGKAFTEFACRIAS
jgi:hypothetical protein